MSTCWVWFSYAGRHYLVKTEEADCQMDGSLPWASSVPDWLFGAVCETIEAK